MSEKNEKRNTVLKDIEGRPMVFGQSDALKYTPYVGTAKEVLDAAIARGDLYYIDPNNNIYPEQSTNRQNVEGWNEEMAEKRKAYEDDLYNTYKRGISKAPGNVMFGAEAQSQSLPESVAYLDVTMPQKVAKPTSEQTQAQTAAVPAAIKEGTPAAKPETTEQRPATTEQPATKAPVQTKSTAAVKKETPAAQPKAPVTPAKETSTPAPAVKTAVEDVQPNEDGGKKTILWPDLPEMEKGNYVEQTEAQIAQAQKSAAEQERRAKRDRDMAILSDIANLVTKGAAMHGGAWKIDKEEARSAVANEKLRALRESNSKLLAEYARRRMEAADADRKDRNAAAKAEYDAKVAQAKWKADEDYRNARLEEETSYHNALLGIQGAREERLKNQGGGNGSGNKEKKIRYINGMAFDYNDDKAVVEAYWRMIEANPNLAVMEAPSHPYPEGKPVSNPSVNQMRGALERGGMTATPPSANNGKKAGFSSGKKAGFK